MRASNVAQRKEEAFQSAGTAVWWKPLKPDEPEEINVFSLEGEIHLSTDLQPSYYHPLFAIEVSGPSHYPGSLLVSC
jgi:hypothetical protein